MEAEIGLMQPQVEEFRPPETGRGKKQSLSKSP